MLMLGIAHTSGHPAVVGAADRLIVASIGRQRLEIAEELFAVVVIEYDIAVDQEKRMFVVAGNCGCCRVVADQETGTKLGFAHIGERLPT